MAGEFILGACTPARRQCRRPVVRVRRSVVFLQRSVDEYDGPSSVSTARCTHTALRRTSPTLRCTERWPVVGVDEPLYEYDASSYLSNVLSYGTTVRRRRRRLVVRIRRPVVPLQRSVVRVRRPVVGVDAPSYGMTARRRCRRLVVRVRRPIANGDGGTPYWHVVPGVQRASVSEAEAHARSAMARISAFSTIRPRIPSAAARNIARPRSSPEI